MSTVYVMSLEDRVDLARDRRMVVGTHAVRRRPPAVETLLEVKCRRRGRDTHGLVGSECHGVGRRELCRSVRGEREHRQCGERDRSKESRSVVHM